MAGPSQAEVEALILELLARAVGADVDSLRAELLGRGSEMPFDSVVLVEFVVELEKRYGVTVPHTTAAAQSLGSVSSFARLIVSLANDQV